MAERQIDREAAARHMGSNETLRAAIRTARIHGPEVADPLTHHLKDLDDGVLVTRKVAGARRFLVIVAD